MSAMTIENFFNKLFDPSFMNKELFKVNGGKTYTYGQVATFVLLVKERILTKYKSKYILIDSKNCPESFILAYACILECKVFIPTQNLQQDFNLTEAKTRLNIDDMEICFLSEVSSLVDQVFERDLNQAAKKIEINNAINHELYVLSTSGTTKQKKSFIIGSSEIDSFLSSCLSFFNFEKKLIFYNFFDLHFDLSIFNLFMPVLADGTLLFPKDENEAILPYDSIFIQQPDVFALTPSHSDFLQNIYDRDFISKFKKIIFCGEILKKSNVEFWKKFKGVEIYNAYGPAECTVFVSAIKVNDFENDNDYGYPIGRPFQSSRFEIKNNELYISGNQVSLSGYINHDNEMFIKNDDLRVFRTGDLVDVDEVGNLFIKGRCDFNIKISARWINLNEIERVCLRCKRINQAVAIPNNLHTSYNLYISLFNVNEQDLYENVIKQEIFNLINNEFSLGFLPLKVIFLDKIPMNSNGKVDRSYLLNLKN